MTYIVKNANGHYLTIDDGRITWSDRQPDAKRFDFDGPKPDLTNAAWLINDSTARFVKLKPRVATV